MNEVDVINTFARYRDKLDDILSRFKRSPSGIHIDMGDEQIFKQIILELKGLFQDEFIDGREYTSEIQHAYMDAISSYTSSPSYHGVNTTKSIVLAVISRIKRNPDILKFAKGGSARALQAYEGLELNPEIARAASGLYRDGHYANAVGDAVKALNGLVRLRSGQEIDGSPLMQKVFSPKNPILKFNELANQSDVDEQTGFMMMFSGAVAGLRNPRAHSCIEDTPERALEFIAFVSLLAKLLDTAVKV